MADGDPIYKLYPNNALNDVSSPLQKRASAYEMEGNSLVRNSIKWAFEEGGVPQGGPYRAQVIWSYGPAHPPPPGHIYDYIEGQDSALLRFPWIVVRIEELMSNIPNPAKYDPNGTPREKFLYWKAIKAHFEVGICFPIVELPEYPQPPPGEWVSVTYTNARKFSGGRYKVLSGEVFNPITYPETDERSNRTSLRVNNNGEIVLVPPTAGSGSVYPNNCDGYEIDGVKYLAAGNTSSNNIVYYFGGHNNQACDDKSSSLHNLLSIISPRFFTIALNIGRHGSHSAYSADPVLNTFMDQFENAPPAEFNNIFSVIEGKIIEQIENRSLLNRPGRTNVSRSIIVFSGGYDAFNKLYDIQDGAMFSPDGSVISGIGFLDSMYSRSANRKITRLARDSGGNIKVMGVHNASVRPRGDRAKDAFDTNLRNAGGYTVRTRESHGSIPAEYINTVIANIV